MMFEKSAGRSYERVLPGFANACMTTGNLSKRKEAGSMLELLFLLILGILMLFKPELLWKIEHMFTVKNGEPTELYLAFMRVGGVFFLIASVVMLVYVAVK